jgi:ABC-type multidrug transport system fused ATPase/permease subunit
MDFYGWVVLLLSVVTAFIVGQWWIVLLGVIGYLLALLVDLAGGRALGRTGAMRLARAEQENRELKAEQARLLGAIQERDEKLEKSKNVNT